MRARYKTDHDTEVQKEMTMRLIMARLLSVLMLSVIATALPSHAEMYIGGQLGISLPNSFSNVQGTGTDSGLKGTDLDLANSPLYGAKIGYFFPRINWLGVEGEFFYSNPHMKQQEQTVSGSKNFPGLGTIPCGTPLLPCGSREVSGAHVRMAVGAINLIARYPGKRFQPYVGAGFGMYFARISNSSINASDTSPGFNVLAGSRFFLTKHLALFGEYKYNRSSFDFGNNVLFKADYSAHNLVAGVSVHF
jgi:opacity protein-like surface antigen